MKARSRHIVACDGVKSKVCSILPNEPDILQAEDKSVWRGLAPHMFTSGKATIYQGGSDSDNTGRSGLIFSGGKNAGSLWTIISDVEDQRSMPQEESRSWILNVVESMGEDSDNFKVLSRSLTRVPLLLRSNCM